MSVFYLRVQPDREKSLSLAKEALQSASPFIEIVPSVLNNAQKAMQVLTAWGIDTKAFLQSVLDEMNSA